MSTPISKLRHVEVAVSDGAAAAATFSELLGIPRDLNNSPGIPLGQMRTAAAGPQHVSLHVDGLRAGDTFIEMISPTHPTAAVQRFIDRSGEGLYFITLQIEKDRDEYARELLARRVVLSGTLEYPPAYRAIWVYPKSGTGTILELGEVTDPSQVWTGGGDWEWHKVPYQGDIRQVRQAVLITRDRDRAVEHWGRFFDMHPCWQGEDARRRWAVLPFGAGDTFLEVREPLAKDGPEAAFLSARGEGLYAILLEAADFEAIRARVEARGALLPPSMTYPGFEIFAINPAVLHGARFEVGRPRGSNPWPPAGPA